MKAWIVWGLVLWLGVCGCQRTGQGPSASPLKIGDLAPQVTLALEDGSLRPLEELRGTHVILYFYPKDDTPGCRVEAQGFRDHYAAFSASNAVVIGVSLQGAASHRAFIQKEGLPFHLAVDSDATIAKAFQVPVQGEYAARHTIIVDPDGKISALWRDVSPKHHAQEVLASLEAATKK